MASALGAGTARGSKYTADYFWAHSIKLLANRPHSRAELTFKLQRLCTRINYRRHQRSEGAARKVDCEAVISAALTKLDDDGHLDDERFSEWFVDQRSRFRSYSRRHVFGELLLKGIDGPAAEAALGDFDEYESCMRRWRKSRNSVLRRGKTTPMRYLLDRGFPVEVARAVIDADVAANTAAREAERQWDLLAFDDDAEDDEDDSDGGAGDDADTAAASKATPEVRSAT